jgi:lysophospholipid acyltransferase (LPLAT)-like uncharacterized protein
LKKLVKSRLGQSCLSFIGFFYIQFVYRTSKFTFENKEFFEKALELDKPLIICFWHQRLIMLPITKKLTQRNFYMLLSPHSDGALISKILKFFNIKSIFGSTFQNAGRAAVLVVRHLKKGDVVGITPDGPRGPMQQASDGVAQLAILSKANILPLTYSIKNHKKLKSWDKFMLPFPFGKGLFLCGEVIDATAFSHKEDLRLIVQNNLNAITQKADAMLEN